MRLPLSFLSFDSPVEADFVVATTGSDDNPGTAAKPFATLARAREAVRKLNAGGPPKATVTVLVRDGTYVLKETLAFGPEDSGTPERRIVYAAYPGEKPVLSGGRELTGWKPDQGKRRVAEVPAARRGGWHFTELTACAAPGPGGASTRTRRPIASGSRAPWSGTVTRRKSTARTAAATTINGSTTCCPSPGRSRWKHCHPHVPKADGTDLKKLASRNGYRGVIDILDVYDFHDGSSDLPVWAANSKSVFYTTKVGSNVELFRVTLDGKSEQLTDSPAGVLHYHPQPSPDGKWLVYGSKRDGVRQLYVMRLRDKKEWRITDLAKGRAAMWPSWQPRVAP
jgi:hypothetical protein